MLSRRAWRGDEQVITARTLAGTTLKIRWIFCWALALGGIHGGGSLTLPVALALQTASLLTLLAGTIAAGGLLASPSTGGGPAGVGAVTGLGPGGPEPAFTALEQTATTTEGLATGQWKRLTNGVRRGKLRRAQGR